jgi:hypothetical protein
MHHSINRVLSCAALLVATFMLAEHGEAEALIVLDKNDTANSHSFNAFITGGDMNELNPSRLPIKSQQKDADADGSVTENSDTDEDKPDSNTPKKDKKGGKKKKDGKWGRRFKKLFDQLPRWVRYTMLVSCGVALLAIVMGITKCYKKYRY